jgi:hypothetical protein
MQSFFGADPKRQDFASASGGGKYFCTNTCFIVDAVLPFPGRQQRHEHDVHGRAGLKHIAPLVTDANVVALTNTSWGLIRQFLYKSGEKYNS